MFSFVFMLQELIFPDYRLLTFCNWLLSQIAFSGGGARGVAGVNICQLPHLIPTLPPAFTPHVIRQSMQFLLSRENYSLFLFLFIHKNIPWMINWLLILAFVLFLLGGLIQPILSMIYFEKDQNAQNLTQSNKCTTGTNSFYGEKIHKKCSKNCPCFDIIVF